MALKKRKARTGLEEQRELHRKLLGLWKRGQSKWCEARESEIHGRGVIATSFIPKGTRIIEYVGEPIDKQESDRRARVQHRRAIRHGDAAVYIFTISGKTDIDGNVPWNTARLINHSCEPNCEAQTEGRRIFIHAIRDIRAGEELVYDYGFDLDHYEDHPCRCGSASCVGYIVSRDQWGKLRKLLRQRTPTAKTDRLPKAG
ncbi:MAG: SET domain-containing protein [Verrucomicrobia bacterium]|nr:SET domain-containing protein [Verrucomicrobiota bacterium]